MQRSRLVPQEPDAARDTPVANSGPCPRCGRPDALRTTRVATGRMINCRYAADDAGACDWEGAERPFRRPTGDAMPAPFVERLGRIAERVVDECAANGTATARIDPQYVTAIRSAVRRAARDRDLQVRTTHVGDGRVEIKAL